MPAGSVLLFFVPIVNLCFFVALTVLPSRSGPPPWLGHRRLDRWIPEAPSAAPRSPCSSSS
jgi:hypothetical protein